MASRRKTDDSNPASSYVNLSAYGFCVFPADQLSSRKEKLLQVAAGFGTERLRGMILLSTERVNIRMCGTNEAVDAMKRAIGVYPQIFVDWNLKTVSERLTLPRMLVRIKIEVISMGWNEVNIAVDGLAAHIRV
ncbi:hypothetical protein PsorP6_000753 [Peronosclerospora sorghi]|uniref:Uncharacterized protein n=1 Tax=Peronosclerospora sorghi TaxID=230839 RepID=A0ACC0WUT1_9STRA|nr:hypothetical protein PsorP6_000753 [Peronosclerospora sorghi]